MLRLSVHFPLGGFEANSNEHLDHAEWPPHPARLFSGLASVADSSTDLEALEWLESLPPPAVVASPAGRTVVEKRANYVVTNAVDRKGRSYMELPARTGGGTRRWARVSPECPDVGYLWSTEVSDAQLAALDGMCRRLPYLGRSTSPAIVWATTQDGEPPTPDEMTWVPDGAGDTPISVPSSGYLRALEDAFSDDQPPWGVTRTWCQYRSPEYGAEASPDEAAIPFRAREWIVFGVEGPRRLPYQSLVALTSAFRSAALAMAGDDAPPILHGHVGPGERVPTERVMFLGLPFVEAPDADGHLLGFAVSIPRGIDESVRAAVYRSLVGVSELRHSKLGKVRLRRTELDPRWGTDPDRWARPSTRWVTAYPAVLDRFVRGDEQITPTIARMCERVGLPTSAHIDWSTAPFISGPDRLSPHHTVRRPGDSVHKFVHVRLTFRRAVAGPIVIGHMRHFGLGLMLPEPARPPESLGGEAHR